MHRLPILLLALAMLPFGVLGTTAAIADEAATAVEVPSLLGKSEAEARAILEDRGLIVDISYVDDDVAPAGTVISQDPKSGAETLAGAKISLRIVGPAPDGGGGEAPMPVDKVAVPSLAGLALKDAEAALIALDLIPRPDFVKSAAAAPFHVLSQDIAATTIVATGTHIRFEVALADEAPATLQLPSLYGLGEADAIAVLSQLGLDASITRVYSNLPQGMVFSQSPAAGSDVAAGAVIALKVAEKPPVNWTPQLAIVPDLKGMSADQARIALLIRGLRSRLKRDIKPNANVHKVFAQNKAAGSQLAVGERVTFYLPEKALVPNLVGLSKAQASAKLQLNGLIGVAIGPNVGIPPTKVISQNRPAGATIARGSTVKFNYKFTGVIQIKVPVPNVIGMSKMAAAAAIQAKGLNANMIKVGGGFGPTKVITQSPSAGTLVFKNTMVTAKYKHNGLILVKVPVPNVVGMSKAAAAAAIQAKGLNANMVKVGAGFGPTKVISQSPSAGTMVFKNTTVTAKYKHNGLILVKVPVPNVVGMSKAAAAAAIQAKGLNANMVKVGAGFGPTKVISQSPSAGTMVFKNTTVTAKYKHNGLILVKVPVPNVVGMSKSAAKALLQQKGLNANMVKVGGGNPLTPSKVISQSPAAGTMVFKGTTVTAKYKHNGFVLNLVKVPNLVGMTKAQAIQVLTIKGLTHQFTGVGIKVKTQNKAAGSMVPKGTKVKMKLGF